MAQDYEQYLHKEWLGLLQPEGLVVSPPALSDLQAFVDREKALALQPILQGLIQQGMLSGQEQTWVPEFEALATQVLEWDRADFVTQAELPEDLAVSLTDYGETLRPDYAVCDPDSEGWLLLVQVVPIGDDLDQDDPRASEHQGWKASYQQKFERLLKGTQVPIGVLWNGTHLRLVYAPSGEASGYLTFPISAMTEVPGRSILGALEMLLGGDRLFNSPTDKTLPKLLETSRNYQANVSTKLAGQVLDALWELLRGFQAADTLKDGAQAGALKALAIDDPQHIYGGLLTTLMRLVFLLYAEDQGLMPDDGVYQGNYAVVGLYEKLREDASLYPDTMDQRYGAWAWLLSLFRLVYDGGGAYEAYLPARHGQLFDPMEYPFLEGRSPSSPQIPSPRAGEGGARSFDDMTDPFSSRGREAGGPEIPRIADGVIYRILAKLLILDGERLSYRSLDVEQIGSVYEAIMGFEVAIAQGQSIAVKPKDVVINLEALLQMKPKDRVTWLQEAGELKLAGKGATALKEAKTIADILAALERRVSERTTQVLMPGSLYLQPGEERRRTGSHYTPRKLTQPIVETTLQPIFAQLGEHPTPAQILDLKVCDLAMGSAAFLVEACRQLAAKLVEAWAFHGNMAEYLPGRSEDPHPPAPSPRAGEGEPEKVREREKVRESERWEVPEAVRVKMVEVARQFRKEPTQSEAILWEALRGKKLQGNKFRRQQPIGSFIVDFFCPSQRLIVEVDGGIHESQRELDQARQQLLESLGLRFVRLSSDLVETDLPIALHHITNAFTSPTLTPTPPTSPTLTPFAPGGRRAGDEGEKPKQLISEIEPILLARRLVAQRCLYGVDRNPFAVNLAKLSLWLVTLSKDLPFTFVDHALKCGDSLVGLSRREIVQFGRDPIQDLPLMKYGQEQILAAMMLRSQIQSSDTVSDGDADLKYRQWQDAEAKLGLVRMQGDVAIAAMFDGFGKSKKDRENLSLEYGAIVREQTERMIEIANRLRNREKPIVPFNWEVEFPEVFDRENPGFDAIVGNPPFAGKNTTINGNAEGYLEYLKEGYPESHGNADLVAYFFRRSFEIVRVGGAYGLIATNTIAQGDTRSTGLRFICQNGGIIYNATRRYKWPGLAAVVVSVVHIFKIGRT